MPMPPPPDPTTLPLGEVARLVAARRLPPVDSWNPAHCGDSHMRIARDGTWFHEGSPIGRIEMVRLFSTLLRREPDGGYVLVTPIEKLDIAVDALPFVAVAMMCEGDGAARRIAFTLNTGQPLVAGADHPIRIEGPADAPRPIVRVRGGLDALIARPVYYELVELALAGGETPPGVWSDGAFFAIASA